MDVDVAAVCGRVGRKPSYGRYPPDGYNKTRLTPPPLPISPAETSATISL
jgi:hypothetical protein